MRARLALLALAATTSGLIAQATNPVNNFYRWDRSTEFTSRGSNGGNPGFVSQGFAHGHSAGLETLTQAYFVMQDQNPSTQESYNLGTTELDAAGRPDYANLNTYATNLLLPMSTQTTPAAWGITMIGLATTPHKLNLKQHTQWHHTWQFNVGANWTSDGISVHMGQAAAYNGTLLCTGANHREIPRTENATQIVEELGWSAVANSTTPAPVNRTWRLRTSFAEFALNGGALNTTYGGFNGAVGAIGCNNTDPNLGYAALDPDFDDAGLGNPARYDDYTWLLSAGSANAGKIAVLFFSQTVIPGGGAPTPFGQLHLDIADPIFGAVGGLIMPQLDSLGQSSLSIPFGPGGSTNTLRPVIADFPSWSAQAAVVTTSGLQLSSLFSFRSTTTPNGFTAATADATTPVKLSRTAAQRTIFVRNDGRGMLTVKQIRGTTTFGTSDVCERTAVRITINPAASDIEISTTTTQPVKFVHAFNK